MGYAHVYDESACQIAVEGFAPQDVTSAVSTAEVDRHDRELMHAALVVTGTVALTGGAANDEIDITLEIEDSATSGSGYADFKSKVFSVVVDDNSTATFCAVLPVKLLKAERYIIGKCTVEAGTGAPTVSSATAGAVLMLFPMAEIPDASYDRDGYIDTTITA